MNDKEMKAGKITVDIEIDTEKLVKLKTMFNKIASAIEEYIDDGDEEE